MIICNGDMHWLDRVRYVCTRFARVVFVVTCVNH